MKAASLLVILGATSTTSLQLKQSSICRTYSSKLDSTSTQNNIQMSYGNEIMTNPQNPQRSTRDSGAFVSSVKYKAPESNPFIAFLPLILFSRRNIYSIVTVFFMLPVSYPLRLLNILSSNRNIGLRLISLAFATAGTILVIIRDLLISYDNQQKEPYAFDDMSMLSSDMKTTDLFSMGMGQESRVTDDQFSNQSLNTFDHVDDNMWGRSLRNEKPKQKLSEDSLWSQMLTSDPNMPLDDKESENEIWGRMLTSDPAFQPRKTAKEKEDELWGKMLTADPKTNTISPRTSVIEDINWDPNYVDGKHAEGDLIRTTEELYGRNNVLMDIKEASSTNTNTIPAVSTDDIWNRGLLEDSSSSSSTTTMIGGGVSGTTEGISIDPDDIWNQGLMGTINEPKQGVFSIADDSVWDNSLDSQSSVYTTKPMTPKTDDDIWGSSLNTNTNTGSLSGYANNMNSEDDLWGRSFGSSTSSSSGYMNNNNNYLSGYDDFISSRDSYSTNNSYLNSINNSLNKQKESNKILTVITAGALGFGIAGPVGALVTATMAVSVVRNKK